MTEETYMYNNVEYKELLIMVTIKGDQIYTWFGKYNTKLKHSMDFLRTKTNNIRTKFSLPPFKLILKLEAPTEEYAHNFLQYVNMATKPFYQNGIGSPVFKNTDINSVKKLFQSLWVSFEKNKPALELIEPIYEHYEHDKPEEGYIYIMDNIKTIKVGLSHDPEGRYYRLKNTNEIYQTAKIEYQMETSDMVLSEALCHAKLCQYKTSNPIIKSRSTRCDKGWDEHFKLKPEEAYEKIKNVIKTV